MSNQRVGATLIFGLLLLNGRVLGANYACTERSHVCTINKLTIETEDDVKTLTIERQVLPLTLNDAKVDYLSPEIMENSGFDLTHSITVAGGTVPKIYLKPSLAALIAYGNKLETIVIPDADNINLRSLYITHNQLKKIPANIGRCKKLVDIMVTNNQIQSLDMTLFSGLTNLMMIDLTSNKIHSVESSAAVQLPSLVTLSLAYNSLTGLQMENWNFPALKSIFLNNNQLSSTNDLAELFPSLTSVKLANNQWSCQWLNAAIKGLRQNHVEFDITEDLCID